jgi:hypothetical protein
MAQGQGIENADQFALANQGLVEQAPAMYSLMNPGRTLTGAGDTAAFTNEFTQAMNTPGQYVDPSGLYDNIFSPEAQQSAGVMGPNSYPGTQEYQSAQINAVYGSLTALAPYMTPTSLAGVQGQLDQAIIEWQDAQLRGDPTDLITFLSAKGAANWL